MMYTSPMEFAKLHPHMRKTNVTSAIFCLILSINASLKAGMPMWGLKGCYTGGFQFLSRDTIMIQQNTVNVLASNSMPMQHSAENPFYNMIKSLILSYHSSYLSSPGPPLVPSLLFCSNQTLIQISF